MIYEALDKKLASFKEVNEKDDWHHYTTSVAARLRGLTRYQASTARRQIVDVLFNAEYNFLLLQPLHHYGLPQFNTTVFSPHPPIASMPEGVQTSLNLSYDQAPFTFSTPPS